VTDTPIAKAGQVPPPATSSGADVAFGLFDAFSGAGVVFMSFLAPIPGLLPAVMLAVLLIAPLFIALLVVGAAAGLVFGIVRVAVRVLAFGVSLVGRGLGRRGKPSQVAWRTPSGSRLESHTVASRYETPSEGRALPVRASGQLPRKR
jgi:hypothetical protein